MKIQTKEKTMNSSSRRPSDDELRLQLLSSMLRNSNGNLERKSGGFWHNLFGRRRRLSN